MSNIRNLNGGNPLADFLSAFNVPNNANHPFFAAFNPEARDRGPLPSYPGPGGENEDPPEVPPPSNEGPPPAGPGSHHQPPGSEHYRRHDRDPFGGRRGGFGHCGRGGWGSRGGWGGPRRGGRCGGGPYGMNFGGFDMSKLGDLISQFAPEDVAAFTGATRNAESNENSKDFSPEADIFDTQDAFVVHVSLPGAKKEDVGVNWDADKSELNIAGVIYRPGDEEFLKTLALDERKVGVFERKVKLGSKESPASVDSDAISAKMEDGILRVTIPKIESFVEVKKVDIE